MKIIIAICKLLYFICLLKNLKLEIQLLFETTIWKTLEVLQINLLFRLW